MPTNYGKKWEVKIKEDLSLMEGVSIDRIYDSVSGYKSISNISDFIAYVYPNIFYLEAKSILGNTFPLKNLTQYDKLKEKVGIKGVRAGVILWFIDHATVLYVPISTITHLMEDGKKSVNIKMLGEGVYNLKLIPSVTKRVFPTCDYRVLTTLNDGE